MSDQGANFSVAKNYSVDPVTIQRVRMLAELMTVQERRTVSQGEVVRIAVAQLYERKAAVEASNGREAVAEIETMDREVGYE